MRYTFPILIILSLLSCKKEQPSMSTLNEGCDCASEVGANFTIEEMASIITSIVRNTETDSIFGDKNVRFYAKEDNAEYTWYIGSEVLLSREVQRYFSNSMVGQTIPITLVVKKKPNLICFPNDDGYDSITKYFTVAQLGLYENYDTTFLEGAYRMKSPLLPDSVDIIIDYREYAGGMNHCFDIYNYNGLGSNIINVLNIQGLNYRQFWNYGGNGSFTNHFEGDVHIRLDNVVEMNFEEIEYDGSGGIEYEKKYLYRGRKL